MPVPAGWQSPHPPRSPPRFCSVSGCPGCVHLPASSILAVRVHAHCWPSLGLGFLLWKRGDSHSLLIAHCLNFTNVIECLMHSRSWGIGGLACSTRAIVQIPGHSFNNTSQHLQTYSVPGTGLRALNALSLLIPTTTLIR